MKKIFDLPVCGSDRAKSFYGKAKIIEKENGEKVPDWKRAAYVGSTCCDIRIEILIL